MREKGVFAYREQISQTFKGEESLLTLLLQKLTTVIVRLFQRDVGGF